MAATLPPPTASRALEPAIAEIGSGLARDLPRPRGPRAAPDRPSGAPCRRPRPGRAALFRFVDVRPACTSPDDLVAHLRDLLADADSPTAQRGARALGHRALHRPAALAAATGVRQMAGRFIVGEDVARARPELERLWRSGVSTTVDLLGEATVTEAEADRYAARCDRALRELAAATDDAELSVKVSALTPQLRATAPRRGADGARDRLRALLNTAKEVGAHLHVDMESFDTRESIVQLFCELLAEPEFAEGPSAGIVLQAYLVEAPDHLEELLAWAREHPRAHPLTVRLVKGAYWDHEVVQAAQHGWAPPVFTDKHETDRCFEALTVRLLDAVPDVRVAIASHNLRSLAAACAAADARGIGREGFELQVLRGLGDPTMTALVRAGRAVRVYAPVGDLVAGMAYLVRRLLENTSNDSFLAAQAGGVDLPTLLAAP
jgi:proline dehydrogenase